MLGRASILALLAGIASATVVSTGLAASSESEPTRRTYSGHSTGKTGRYVRASGRAHISLTLIRTGEKPDPPFVPLVEYAVTIKVVGGGCPRAHPRPSRRCLSINGTLTGKAEDLRNEVGDAARKIHVTSASGQMRPMGNATASGTLAGTGFVAKGSRTLALTIQSKGGMVQLDAEGPPLGGFAPP